MGMKQLLLLCGQPLKEELELSSLAHDSEALDKIQTASIPTSDFYISMLSFNYPYTDFLR